MKYKTCNSTLKTKKKQNFSPELCAAGFFDLFELQTLLLYDQYFF